MTGDYKPDSGIDRSSCIVRALPLEPGLTLRMTRMTQPPVVPLRTLASQLDQFAVSRPDVTLAAPYLIFLALFALRDVGPPEAEPALLALRGLVPLAVAWLFRRHLPPWGKPHWLIAVGSGVFLGWGWIVGQYFFDEVGLPGRLPGWPGEKTTVDPRSTLGAGGLFWTTWWMRLTVACTTVPVVEELFWRALLLRLLIDWSHFERVPLGSFTWFSFLGTSLLSTLQHPDNWAVSILCWFAFNGLLYWTRSLLCLVISHGVTNLVLYLLTLRVGEWAFY